MPIFNLDQTKLFCTAPAKRAHEAALLLIHGAGGTHLTWPRELRRLDCADVFAVDLPGHGRSSRLGRTTVEAYADTVSELIDALQLKQLFLMGHSMGGAIALALALRSRPAIAGLILIGTGARLRVTDQILSMVLSDYDRAVNSIAQYSWADTAPETLVRSGQELLMAQDPAVVHGDYTACNNFDVMGRLGEISVPTLVISGSEDRLTPVKYGDYLSKSIPGAQHRLVEGGGHMMALEQGSKVAKFVSQFLHALRA